MSKFLIAILFLILGGLLGFAAGATLGLGGGAGIGIATGLSAGACGVAKAAQEEGLLTAEQVDQVFSRAIVNLSALSPDVEAGTDEIAGGAAECDAVLDKLRQVSKQ